ncbi:hypothetical protein D9M68_769110 [compost metagenome]
MGEVDTGRVPVRAEQGCAEAMHHADGQLDGLTAVRGVTGDHLFTNDHGLAGFLDIDRQRVVEQVAVLHDHLQRIAQAVLVAEQQADLAEVGQMAQFGHAQAEGLAAAFAGGLFHQTDGSLDRYALLRVVECSLAQASIGQQCMGVQAVLTSHFQIVGQHGGTGLDGHGMAHFQAIASKARGSDRLLAYKEMVMK